MSFKKNKKNLKIFLIALIFLFAGNNVFAINYSLEFDGNNDYVNCGNNASLDFGSEDFTILFWAEFPDFEEERDLIAKKNSEGFELFMTPAEAEGQLRFEMVGTTSTADVSLEYFYPNVRYHITALRKNNVFYLFQNATSPEQSSVSVGSINNNADLLIGYFARGFLKGIIDEVRIYNRALSEVEILEHYNGIFENETGLKLYLSMNEGAGEVAFDSSGFENHGAIYGATYTTHWGMSDILSIEPEMISSAMSYAGDLFTDLSLPIILTIGLPLGFWVIKKIISLV